MAERRPSRRRATEKEAGGPARRRRPAKKSGPNPALLIGGVVGLIGIAIVSFFVFNGEEPKQEDPKKTEQASSSTAKKKGDSLFDAGGSGESNAGVKDSEENGDPNSSGKSAKKDPDAGRTRVVGREPRPVKELDELLAAKHRLYVTKDLRTEIEKLRLEAERFKRESWDATKAMNRKAAALGKKVREAKRDRFLSEADGLFKQLNTRLTKSELHRKDSSGSLFDQPLFGHVQKPYAIYVQRSAEGGEKEAAEKTVKELEALRTAFTDFFGSFVDLEKKKKKTAVKILLLRNGKEYQAYNRIRNPEQDLTGALAHYQPKDGLLVVPMEFGVSGDEDPEHKRREVMFHEGTHQLLDYFTGKNHLSTWGAMWSDEGVAEYFAGHHLAEDGTFHFGRMNHRIKSLEGQRGKAMRVPLKRFLRHTRYSTEKMKKEGKVGEAALLQNSVYAQGWALVYFMWNYNNGEFRTQFQEIMRDQIEEGDAGARPFMRAFKDDQDRFTAFEAKYDDFLDYLATARSDGKITKDGIIPDPEG